MRHSLPVQLSTCSKLNILQKNEEILHTCSLTGSVIPYRNDEYEIAVPDRLRTL